MLLRDRHRLVGLRHFLVDFLWPLRLHLASALSGHTLFAERSAAVSPLCKLSRQSILHCLSAFPKQGFYGE